MAYRKTDKVIAQLAAKRAGLIEASIGLVDREGAAALTIDRLAAEAMVSVGGIYKHFPDKAELYAAVVAHVLAGDCAAMVTAAPDSRDPLARLHAALVALYRRFSRARLHKTMLADPGYRDGLRRALRPLLRGCVDDEAGHIRALSAAILGALAGLHESGYGSAILAADFALRGIGTPTRKLPDLMSAARSRG